ncbi:MAG: PhzF family phenazine biosynthesis protein [Haloarculaceae archaeon]
MDVLVVDAFATEPMAGRPVAVFPDADLTGDQYRAVAEELGAAGALAAEPDGLYAVGARADVALAVAAGALVERGRDPGPATVRGPRDLEAAFAADGTVTVELPAAESRPVEVSESEVADALGVDRAALADVGADLPMARVSAGAGYLAVPVNFMEHLGNADPDREWVAGVLDETDTEALYAFTFDTLAAETDWNARVFTREGEVATSARAAAAAAGYVRRQGALDADRESLVAASGHFIDRPSRVRVELAGAGPTVAGTALPVFDGTVTVPEPDEDDILEV